MSDPLDEFLKEAGEEADFGEYPGAPEVKVTRSSLNKESGQASGDFEVVPPKPLDINEAMKYEEMAFKYKYVDFCPSSDNDEDEGADDEGPPGENATTDSEQTKVMFDNLAKKMKDVSPLGDGGVMKRILRHGHGDIIPPDCKVTFHCSGQSEAGQFDSSYLRRRPSNLNLANHEGVPGLQIGLATMKKGELAELLISPDYAYGSQGVPPRIPPNAKVLYKVDLLRVASGETVEDLKRTSKTSKSDIPMSNVVKACAHTRDLAKQMVQNRRYRPASAKYEKAIQVLEDWPVLDEPAELLQRAELLTLYLNLATVKYKLGSWEEALEASESAMSIEERSPKALYYAGMSSLKRQNVDVARRYLLQAHQILPSDRSIAAGLAAIDKAEVSDAEKRQTLYKKMFSDYKGREDARSEASKLRNMSPGKEALKKSIEEKLTKMVSSETVQEVTFAAAAFDAEDVDVVIEAARSLHLHVEPFDDENKTKYLKIMKKPGHQTGKET